MITCAGGDKVPTKIDIHRPRRKRPLLPPRIMDENLLVRGTEIRGFKLNNSCKVGFISDGFALQYDDVY